MQSCESGESVRVMALARAIAVAVGLNVIAGVTSALAGQQVYVYAVVHPLYGKIGTLTDTVARSPEMLRIDSRLRIAVELLGIVVYRQKTDITEIMHGDRLVSLQSVSEKDGHHLEVHGEAQGDRFVVSATAGAFTGPATTAPSDPWVLEHTGEGTVVYPSTGKIMNAQISGGGYETVSVNGEAISARHFAVTGANREEVWLDSQGIPVMFRPVEDGTPIDFVLQKAALASGTTPVTYWQTSALARFDGGNR